MFSLNDKISLRQLQILLILDIFGVGVTFLPRTVAGFAEQDGWICVIMATAAVIFFSYVITSLAGMFPNDTFTEYSSKLLTRPIGILLSAAFVIKMALIAAFELRFFGEIVHQLMLKDTPLVVIIFTMLFLSAFAAAKGYEARARLAEVLILVVFIPLIFVCLVAASDVDFENLLPVAVSSSPQNIGWGSYNAIFAFSGIDFCLLAFPYLSKPEKARKSVIQAVALIGILMTVITIVTIAKFGPYDLKRQMWPVLEMMDTVDLPGSLLENQGALIMSFWIVSVFAVINARLFFSSLLLKDVCKSGKHFTYIVILLPIIFGLSFLPASITDTFQYFQWLNHTFSIAFFIFIPLILLLAAKLKKAGARHET